MKRFEILVYMGCPFFFAIVFLFTVFFGAPSPSVEVTILKVGFALLFMSFFCVCGLLARIIAELEASRRSGESASPSHRT